MDRRWGQMCILRKLLWLQELGKSTSERVTSGCHETSEEAVTGKFKTRRTMEERTGKILIRRHNYQDVVMK